MNKLLAMVVITPLLTACYGPGQTAPASRQSRTNLWRPTPTVAPIAKPAAIPVRWRFSEENDSMGRGKIRFAHIQSFNTIELEPPYDGSQHATLYIRRHPAHGTDVYIAVEKGQMLDSRFHSPVLVRFDQDKVISFPTARPDDLSSNVLFLQGNIGSRFIERLKTAKTVRMHVPFYRAGIQEIDFAVHGFKWQDQQ